jgi:hypothetical protein
MAILLVRKNFYRSIEWLITYYSILLMSLDFRCWVEKTGNKIFLYQIELFHAFLSAVCGGGGWYLLLLLLAGAPIFTRICDNIVLHKKMYIVYTTKNKPKI